MHSSVISSEACRIVAPALPSLPTRASSPPGFLVADARCKLLSANDAALSILTYGQDEGRAANPAEVFETKLRNNLVRRQPSSGTAVTALQFRSGRRTYFCRAFMLESARNVPSTPAVLLILERGVSEAMALSQIVGQFHLTRREHEAVSLLLQGLSNKEMADRMAISANTVKALLRMLMAKMQVSSRSTVVATILRLMMSAPPKLN